MSVSVGIDLEDITHTPAYRKTQNPENIDFDLEETTSKILDLLEKHEVEATFFVVSSLLDEHKDLLETIRHQGHEIASHTVNHRSLTDISWDECRFEVVRSKKQLEESLDIEVEGFRAPTCQVNEEVYRSIIKAGYSYSSSVMPSRPIPGFYSKKLGFEEAVVLRNGDRGLVEYPVSVSPYLRLPVSGAWIRLLGRNYFYKSVEYYTSRGKDVVLYSHPWEFGSLQKTNLPFKNKVRTGPWLQQTYQKLLSKDYEFRKFEDIIPSHG